VQTTTRGTACVEVKRHMIHQRHERLTTLESLACAFERSIGEFGGWTSLTLAESPEQQCCLSDHFPRKRPLQGRTEVRRYNSPCCFFFPGLRVVCERPFSAFMALPGIVQKRSEGREYGRIFRETERRAMIFLRRESDDQGLPAGQSWVCTIGTVH
jgi:hypothetical protein